MNTFMVNGVSGVIPSQLDLDALFGILPNAESFATVVNEINAMKDKYDSVIPEKETLAVGIVKNENIKRFTKDDFNGTAIVDSIGKTISGEPIASNDSSLLDILQRLSAIGSAEKAGLFKNDFANISSDKIDTWKDDEVITVKNLENLFNYNNIKESKIGKILLKFIFNYAILPEGAHVLHNKICFTDSVTSLSLAEYYMAKAYEFDEEIVCLPCYASPRILSVVRGTHNISHYTINRINSFAHNGIKFTNTHEDYQPNIAEGDVPYSTIYAINANNILIIDYIHIGLFSKFKYLLTVNDINIFSIFATELNTLNAAISSAINTEYSILRKNNKITIPFLTQIGFNNTQNIHYFAIEYMLNNAYSGNFSNTIASLNIIMQKYISNVDISKLNDLHNKIYILENENIEFNKEKNIKTHYIDKRKYHDGTVRFFVNNTFFNGRRLIDVYTQIVYIICVIYNTFKLPLEGDLNALYKYNLRTKLDLINFDGATIFNKIYENIISYNIFIYNKLEVVNFNVINEHNIG